mgnify:CR=1 FL=1
MGKHHSALVLGALAALCSVAAAPARADSVERLQWLSTMTDRGAWGVQLARDQMAQNQLLEAIATLERVMLNHPEETEAQLLHASLLCRVDDPQGAAMEFGLLHKANFADQSWADAIAPCPPGVTTATGKEH